MKNNDKRDLYICWTIATLIGVAYWVGMLIINH